MKTIFVIGNIKHRILDLIKLCRLIKDQGKIIFIVDRIPQKLANLIYKNDFILISFYNKMGKNDPEVKNKELKKKIIIKNKKWQIFKNRVIYKLSLYHIYKYIKYKKQLKKDYLIAKKLFKEYKPNLIIAEGDRALRIAPTLLKVAKEKKIKIVIPYLTYSGTSFLLRKDCNNFKLNFFSNIFSQYIFRKFKDQALSYNNQKYYFYEAYRLLALKKLGMLSDYPWSIGNGLSDIVCVDNKHTYMRYIKMRVKKEKLVIVGDVSYDALYKIYKDRIEIKNKIIKKYKLNYTKKIIILALPQLAEHKRLDWDTHWIEIKYLVNVLSTIGINILISLHPRMNRENYDFINKISNCTLLDERLFDVLPIADLFVAGFSSTIIWAVLCGINNIVINFYGLNFDIYDFLKSIKIINKKENFKKNIIDLLNKKVDFSDDWKNLSRDQVFDGNTGDRYNRLFNKAIAEYHSLTK
jgi:hypothetical protein